MDSTIRVVVTPEVHFSEGNKGFIEKDLEGKASGLAKFKKSSGNRCRFFFQSFKGTPGYKNKLLFIGSQLLIKTNGAATFVLKGILGI